MSAASALRPSLAKPFRGHGRHGSYPRGPRLGQRPRYSIRPFYFTVAVLSVLALISVYASRDAQIRAPGPQAALVSRNVHPFEVSDEECRLVHTARDQCAFITKHCPDDEPGFLAYLDLYYCRLPHVKAIPFIILTAWLGLLFSTIGIAASDFFCINLSTIATILGMSESMAGVTFLAFGNGSPDVFSTFAAMSTNSSSLAIGELIGAAGFITAVVAGSMALVRPFRVAKKSFIRDVGFFVVAACFSMGFLADGRLRLWECIAMVVFYVFYVAVVVVWHWWITRRKQRREKEAAARGHYLVSDDAELEIQDEYHDEDESAESSTRPPVSRGASGDDFSMLERGPATPRTEDPDEDEEEEEEVARDRWMGELSSNMRLSKPAGRSRRNTLTPIRPSLVGALEFQAVLSSLQKSRNIQTIPMHSRRYSDDPAYTTAQQQDHMSTTSDPASRPPQNLIESEEERNPRTQRSAPGLLHAAGSRARAVSASDAAALRADPRFLLRQPSSTLIDITEDDDETSKAPSVRSLPRQSSNIDISSPNFEVSPAEPEQGLDNPAPDAPQKRQTSYEFLAPPTGSMPTGFHPHYHPTYTPTLTRSPEHSPRSHPQALKLDIPKSPRSRSPLASPGTSPFPAYREASSGPTSRPSSLLLPPPASVSVASQACDDDDDDVDDGKPLRWWPYNVLPPPWVLVSTLFPTLYGWHARSWWEKFLGVIAAPSVFLLTVTLPVVELERENEGGDADDTGVEQTEASRHDVSIDTVTARRKSVANIMAESPEVQTLRRDNSYNNNGAPVSSSNVNGSGHGNTATIATDIEQRHHHNKPSEAQPLLATSSAMSDAPPHPHGPPGAPKPWNRWLTITQLFTSPLFIVVILYTQYLSPSNLTQSLIRGILISLLSSTVVLIPLLLTTTPSHRPPAYRTILSLAGFVVSIAWISTIASQVVALLKTFAIILNMSHAILGLTVFAVGNSLGDLVADITVARLGYPVMALSACFGGPMLNILLGIGLSGSWILIRGAEKRHARHPDKEIHFKSYEIEVGQTLVVSGIVLLITLVGLLIVVPLNRWMMTRRIAWALIALWTVGTIVNVVLEVVGIGEGRSKAAG